MIIDQQSIIGDQVIDFPDWCFGEKPLKDSEIKERIIIIGGNSSANVSIRGTADQREDKPW